MLTLLNPHIWALSLTLASKPPPLNIAQSMKPQEMLFHDVLKDQIVRKPQILHLQLQQIFCKQAYNSFFIPEELYKQ